MALLHLALAGGVIYAGRKSYNLFKKNTPLVVMLQSTEQQSSSIHPAVTFARKADNTYQQFVQQKIDPLFTGSTRRKQMIQLSDDSGSSTLSPLSEEEQRINRLIAVSGVTIGLATLGSTLFPALLIPTVALGTYLMLPLYKRTFKTLFQKRKLTLDLLASLYMTSFWLQGYYVFAGLAYALFFTGIKIVHLMEGRSQENLTNLFGTQPRFVWRLVDGVEVQTDLEDLEIGDVVVVNAGEPFPVDGVVIDGLGSVDQQMLTGESQLVEKEVGDTVFALTLLLGGRLCIRVEKTGQNILTAQIAEILKQTASSQTDAQLRGQELTEKTVLPTLTASLLALSTVGFRGASAALGAGFGINMHVVSSLTTMNYLTIASQHNILVKDGRALDKLKDVDTIVFDKTGTLTLDAPHVAQIHILQAGFNEAEVLTYAATAEYRQHHPIAKAIINAAQDRGLTLPEIDEASYEVGYGIKVKVQEKLIRVGSHRFMTKDDIVIPTQIESLQPTCQEQGHTLVLVAIDEQVVGALELHATIRPEAKQVVQALRKRNLSLVIISGDREMPTQKLASELGIENYFANTLPQNKASLIQQLQDAGRVVCFIGDGINDAIALKQADVSISLRGATTIATDTAQIVLMDQTLNQVNYLFSLAYKFDKTIQRGLLTTIIPGIICIGGVFVAGFGIIAAEILFQIGFFSGLSVAMSPLLTEGKTE